MKASPLLDKKLSGAFIINKPVDFTSSDVVSKLKRPLTENGYAERGFKIGHGGTLDPFATGVLVVLVGEATKLADSYLHSFKAYDGVMKLGTRTDTADLTGQSVETKPIPSLSEAEWQKLANSFTQEEYLQIPPMYSAKKKDGISLHELARKGVEVHREAILKKITRFEVKPISETELHFSIECESGTYVRVIAEDLANRAGTVAHLTELRRTRSSDAEISNTHSLTALIECLNLKTEISQIPCFRPLNSVASHLKSLVIDQGLIQNFRSGIQSTIQGYCKAANLHHPKERYVVVRARTNDAPIGLLEKAPLAPEFRLQRVIL